LSICRGFFSPTPSLTTDYLLPPWIDDWLTQDHLARFVVEVIDALDFSNLSRQYAGCGSKEQHLKADSLVLYDLSSSCFEGSHCPLGQVGRQS